MEHGRGFQAIVCAGSTCGVQSLFKALYKMRAAGSTYIAYKYYKNLPLSLARAYCILPCIVRIDDSSGRIQIDLVGGHDLFDDLFEAVRVIGIGQLGSERLPGLFEHFSSRIDELDAIVLVGMLGVGCHSPKSNPSFAPAVIYLLWIMRGGYHDTNRGTAEFFGP